MGSSILLNFLVLHEVKVVLCSILSTEKKERMGKLVQSCNSRVLGKQDQKNRGLMDPLSYSNKVEITDVVPVSVKLDNCLFPIMFLLSSTLICK